MGVAVVEGGVRRVLAPEDVAGRLLEAGVPHALVESLAGAVTETARIEAPEAHIVPQLLASLPQVAATVWAQAPLPAAAVAQSEKTGHVLVYGFVAPPVGACLGENAYEVLVDGQRVPVTYKAIPKGGKAWLRAANRALVQLGRSGYRLDLPASIAGRRKRARQLLGAFQRISVVQPYFALARLGPNPARLAEPPGALPKEVEGLLAECFRAVQLLDVLDDDRVQALATLLGAGGPPTVEPPRPPEAYLPYLKAVPHLLGALEPARRKLGALLAEGVPAPGILNGEDLVEGASLDKLEAGMLGGAPRMGLAIHVPAIVDGAGAGTTGDVLGDASGTPVPVEALEVPGEGAPTTLVGAPGPIVFAVSDLHLGQGGGDNADDVYEALESAYVAMIKWWEAQVQAHRARPENKDRYTEAILVLNGDIFDFWSADIAYVKGAPAGHGVPGAFHAPGAGGGPAKKVEAGERLLRIATAHARFVEAVKTFAAGRAKGNHVYYVGGNHDDYLWRFGLGAKLEEVMGAKFLYPHLYLPELEARFEHGHRNDPVNDFPPPKGGPQIGCSLGELMVSLSVNPVERGGVSVIGEALKHTKTASILQSLGLQPDEFDAIKQADAILQLARKADPASYDGIMGEIDNLTRDTDASVLADMEEAYEKGMHQPEQPIVHALRNLASCWLDDTANDEWFRAWCARWLFPSWIRFFGGLFNSSPADQRANLNWSTDPVAHPSEGTPLILCVGHTHEPAGTDPSLAQQRVATQFVNTGTGQDTFDAETDPDRLISVQRSQGCLMRLVRDTSQRTYVEVTGLAYRSLAVNPPAHGCHFEYERIGANYVRLPGR